MYLPESKAKFNEIYSYSPPELYENQDWYVGFYAFDPALGKLHFKKIKLNYIKKIGERRAFAKGLIKRLNSQLEKGWNPWIESTNNMTYQYLDDVCDHYRKYIKKLHEDGVYRKDTYVFKLILYQ